MKNDTTWYNLIQHDYHLLGRFILVAVYSSNKIPELWSCWPGLLQTTSAAKDVHFAIRQHTRWKVHSGLMACTVQGKNGNSSCHGLESFKIEIWWNMAEWLTVCFDIRSGKPMDDRGTFWDQDVWLWKFPCNDVSHVERCGTLIPQIEQYHGRWLQILLMCVVSIPDCDHSPQRPSYFQEVAQLATINQRALDSLGWRFGYQEKPANPNNIS